MTLSLYTLHSTKVDGEFIIQKFDSDYHCESVYALTQTECQCPQGHKPKCRHRTMLSMFLAHGHIGDGWFLEWDTRMWRRPVNDINTTPMLDEAAPISAEAWAGLADETVMGTSAHPAVDWLTASQPGYGVEAAPSPEGTQAPLPPSPPEGHSLSPSAEAAPSSPVVGGATIVKRRKIP